MTVGIVTIARNEEKRLEQCLASLKKQTVSVFLVVVDDGSTDRTGEIARLYADVTVDLPSHKENWAGTPRIAKVFNSGLKVIEANCHAYVMISGADTVYPSDYVEKLTQRMNKRNIVLASGVAESEVSRSMAPRGTGRIMDAQWFRSVGFQYPENYGFESYFVYKALSQNQKIYVAQDLKLKFTKETNLSTRKMFLWGKAMKALNFWWIYAFLRACLIGLKHASKGIALIAGYLSGVPAQYDDIKEFVPKYQRRLLFVRGKEVLKGETV
jgi:glycosyltransferase involved in cell wall biosynthesis